MKMLKYILIGFLLISSCSSDNEDMITVNIEEGILGVWHDEMNCHIPGKFYFEFYEDKTFDYYFADNYSSGTYSLSGNNLTVNFIELGEIGLHYEYKIIVLTPDTLKLDEKESWPNDRDYVRDCNQK